MTQTTEPTPGNPPKPWNIPTREPSAVITEHPAWCEREEEPGWDSVTKTFCITHESKVTGTFDTLSDCWIEDVGTVRVEHYVDEDVPTGSWPAPKVCLVLRYVYHFTAEDARKLRDGLTAALEILDEGAVTSAT